MSEHPEQDPDSDENRRTRLKARGWHQAAGTLFSKLMWRSPAGRLLTEEEAFQELARAERKDQHGGS